MIENLTNTHNSHACTHTNYKTHNSLSHTYIALYTIECVTSGRYSFVIVLHASSSWKEVNFFVFIHIEGVLSRLFTETQDNGIQNMSVQGQASHFLVSVFTFVYLVLCSMSLPVKPYCETGSFASYTEFSCSGFVAAFCPPVVNDRAVPPCLIKKLRLSLLFFRNQLHI